VFRQFWLAQGKGVKAREGRQGKGRAARQGKAGKAREGRQGKGGKARDGRLYSLRCVHQSFVIFLSFYINITKLFSQMCSENCGVHMSACNYTGSLQICVPAILARPREGRQGKGRLERQGKGGKARDGRLNSLRCELESFAIFFTILQQILQNRLPRCAPGIAACTCRHASIREVSRFVFR
jgi:hypothetical protein